MLTLGLIVQVPDVIGLMQALFWCQIERMVHSSQCISLYFILLVTFTTVSSVLTPEFYLMVHLTPLPHYPPVLVAHLSLVLVPHTGLAGPILAQAKAQKSCLPRTSPYRCIRLAHTIFPAVHCILCCCCSCPRIKIKSLCGLQQQLQRSPCQWWCCCVLEEMFQSWNLADLSDLLWRASCFLHHHPPPQPWRSFLAQIVASSRSCSIFHQYWLLVFFESFLESVLSR